MENTTAGTTVGGTGLSTVVLGSMTFGKQIDIDTARKVIQLFIAKNGGEVSATRSTITVEIDTAFMYEDGKSEEMLGELMKELMQNQSKSQVSHLLLCPNPRFFLII